MNLTNMDSSTTIKLTTILLLIVFAQCIADTTQQLDGGGGGGGGSALPITPVCGSGTIGSPETCDDGNTVSGDGCSSSCTI